MGKTRANKNGKHTRSQQGGIKVLLPHLQMVALMIVLVIIYLLILMIMLLLMLMVYFIAILYLHKCLRLNILHILIITNKFL